MAAEPAVDADPAATRDRLVAALGIEVGLDETSTPATFDVPAPSWVAALTWLRDHAGLDYFDWLSAVDRGAEGFAVVAHVAVVGQPGSVRHLLVRTALPAAAPSLETATGVFRGAAWHERETHEMFGIAFPGHPHLVPLLLPDAFEGHPLRKDFMLAARAAKPWPGAKEPGESGTGAPSRRRLQPPGVPDESWGPREPAAGLAEPEPEPVAERGTVAESGTVANESVPGDLAIAADSTVAGERPAAGEGVAAGDGAGDPA